MSLSRLSAREIWTNQAQCTRNRKTRQDDKTQQDAVDGQKGNQFRASLAIVLVAHLLVVLLLVQLRVLVLLLVVAARCPIARQRAAANSTSGVELGQRGTWPKCVKHPSRQIDQG